MCLLIWMICWPFFLSLTISYFMLQVGKKVERGARSPSSPPGLFFQHAGHRFEFAIFTSSTYLKRGFPATQAYISEFCCTLDHILLWTGLSCLSNGLAIFFWSPLLHQPESKAAYSLTWFLVFSLLNFSSRLSSYDVILPSLLHVRLEVYIITSADKMYWLNFECKSIYLYFFLYEWCWNLQVDRTWKPLLIRSWDSSRNGSLECFCLTSLISNGSYAPICNL